MALKFLNNGYFAGEVGIGTESPDSKLEVSQQLSAASTIDYPYTISSRDDGNSINQAGGEGVGIKFRIAGNAATTPGNSLVGASIAAIRESSSDTDSSTGLGFFITQNDETLDEALRIDHDGNVGIGTDDPVAKLHVDGTAIFDTQTGAQPFYITRDGAANQALKIYVDDAAAIFESIQDEAADNYGAFQFILDAGVTEPYFDVRKGAALANTLFRVDGNGNVGIGTTGPGAKLDVQGTIRVNNEIQFVDANMRIFRSSNDMRIRTGGSDKVTILSGGNVGIGTTNPNAKLDVQSSTTGNLLARVYNPNTGTSSSAAFRIASSANNANSASLQFSDSTAYTATISGDRVQGLVFRTSASGSNPITIPERMRITPTGNVGIGTTSPASEANLSLGANSTSEGGHLVLFKGTSQTQATHLDNYANTFRIMNGADASSGAVQFSLNHTTAAATFAGDITLGANHIGRDDDNYIGFESDDLIKFRVAGATQVKISDGVFTAQTDSDVDLGSSGVRFKELWVDSINGGSVVPGSYLPLAGGTMTGDLKLNDAVQLKLGTSNDLRIYHSGTNSNIENNNGTLQIIQNLDDGDIVFKSDNGSGNTTPYFQLDGSHTQSIAWKDIHFVDGIKAKFGDYASPDLQIYHDSSDNNSYIKELGTGSLQIWAKDFEVYNADGTETLINADVNAGVQLYFDNSTKIATTSAGIAVTGGGTFTTSVTASGNSNSFGNTSIAALTATSGAFSASVTATGNSNSFGVTTFTGNVTANGYLTLTGQATPQLFMQSNTSGTPNWTLIAGTNGTFTIGRAGVANDFYFNSSGSATFTSKAYGVAPITSDPSSTIATKGYVDTLITGATIYRGTWDPDVSLNSGYGNPNLNTVTKTSGYYYICSADGAATPNGTGNEPDSWNTGDWVIWNDDVGTSGEWQKIDNSSVLSGVGTGQTVALWQGASSVTDSETLGNAPITVSGNNSTFAGDVILDDGSGASPRLILKNSSNETWEIFNGTHGVLNFYENSDLRLSFAQGGDATFGGKIIAEKGVQFTGGTIASATTVLHTNNVVYARGGSSGMFLQNADGSDGIFIANDHIRLETGSAERMRINSNGNVGIKTTSPANPLSINFAPYGISSITTSNNSTAWNTSSAIMLEGASNSNGLGFGVSGTANDRKSWIQSGHPDQQYANSLGTLAINPLGGNVGIGTTSPGAKLEVSGSLFFRDFVRGYVGTGTTQYVGATWLNASDGVFYVRSADVDKVVLNSNGDSYFNGGNVGIGKTNPGAKLQIVNTSASTAALTVCNFVTGASDYIFQRWQWVESSTNYRLDLKQKTSLNVVKYAFDMVNNGTGYNDVLVLDRGKVGIGTASPTGLLTLSGDFSNTATEGLYITNTGTATADDLSPIAFTTRSSNWGTIHAGTIACGTTSATNGGGYLIFGTSSTGQFTPTERMRITSSGNVGIGTTSPNSKLQIVGKATSSSTVSTDAATTLVTKDYVDSSAGNPSHFRQGHKSHTLTNAFTTCLTVNLNSHTGCYVTVCCFGDWGSHSSAAYRGEFFLQNGANGYSEPGIILRQDDNTSNGTDQIVCQILDPTGSGNPKDFEIQIRTTATTGTTSFTGLLTFTVQGQFNSVT